MQIKQIKGFEDYFISEYGVVTNIKGLTLKTQVNADGYLVINIKKDGKDYHKRINRLVAENFLDNPENLPVVNHIDHDRQNNHFSNLEWCTVKHNTNCSVKLFPDRWKKRAVITGEDAEIICKMIEEGYRNKDISESLNVTIDTVKHIRNGATWTEVSCNYCMKPSYRACSESTIKWVCHKIKEGYPNREILKMSECNNLTNSIIKRIRAKKTWTEISSKIF